MRKYILIFEYDAKKFMDIEKIIVFSKNLEKLEEKEISIDIVFFGNTSNEEISTFMSYFNSLLKKKVCNFSISLKTKEIIIEKGINNKSIKLSSQNAKEVKDKNFDNIIKEYYQKEDISIKLLPTKDWESIVLDFSPPDL